MRDRPLTRPRPGAAILFFLMVAMPLLLIGGALAGDISQMVKANREVSNATEAAAVAGAFQFQGGSTMLDRPSVDREVDQLLERAQANGSVGVDLQYSNPTVTMNDSGSQRVTVTVTYTLRPYGFIAMLNAFFGAEGNGNREFTVVRTADVCIPGVSGYTPTGGSCTRPGAVR